MNNFINPVFGFLDESSSLNNCDYFFCVAIVCTFEQANKQLADILVRARKKIVKKKTRSQPELKFNNSSMLIRNYILSELAKANVEIVVLVLDKNKRRIEDTPENYGLVVGNAIALIAKHHHLINLTIDNRYTNPRQRRNFLLSCEQTAINLAPGKLGLVINPPVDSAKEKLVQLTDFVAGAFNRKYNFGESTFSDLLTGRVIDEVVLSWKETKKRAVRT